MFPGEADYRTEREAFLATMESLTDDEFEHGTTLCEGWAPRDVAAHLLGVDTKLTEYVKARGNLDRAHAEVVRSYRELDRPAFMARLRSWASSPALTSRTASLFLMGDLCIHHQDVLRGLGRNRALPLPVRDSLYREACVLGAPKLLRFRLVPNDGSSPRGRGKVVTGTSEALALWITGRESLASELTFA